MIVEPLMGPSEPPPSPAPHRATSTYALLGTLLSRLALTAILASVGCSIDVLYERPVDEDDEELDETESNTTEGDTDSEGDTDDTDDADTDDPLTAELLLNRVHPPRRRGDEGRLILVR